MSLKDLVPRNDFTQYIPDYLLDDEIPPSIFSSMESYFKSQGMSLRDYVGFVSGATEHQQIVWDTNDRKNRGVDASERDSYSTWFKTEDVIDVRIFFRSAPDDDDRVIGSKMRLYSTGKPYGGDTLETQQLDSGFLTTPGFGSPSMVYQRALAATMAYKALYCIGGAANIRKINVPAKNKPGAKQAAPSYRHISHINAAWDKSIDRNSYTHILDPACRAAGVPNGFFDRDFLDGVLHTLLTSKSYDEMLAGMTRLPEELFEEEIKRIDVASNSRDANLSGEKQASFDRSPGLNVVETMRQLHKILQES